MQFLLVFEKVKEEKDGLRTINSRLEEELTEEKREHAEELTRLTREFEEKVRLAREEGSLSTTITYSISNLSSLTALSGDKLFSLPIAVPCRARK